MSEREFPALQPGDLGPWEEWTTEEIFNEIHGGSAQVIPEPPDDGGE
ncbi:hypothetical protein GCM10023321_84540 [Pseudonocardia eucalypti]|uniref:Uncharacterized protein n=1 Tax=Pseudonocardia eucalypti TaxID=648755 RepID=A0ABP9RFR8_9PSEU